MADNRPQIPLDKFPGIAALIGKNGSLISANSAFFELPERSSYEPPHGRPYCRETFFEMARRCFQGEDSTFETGELSDATILSWYSGIATRIDGDDPCALVQCISTLAGKIRESRLERANQFMIEVESIANLGTWERILATGEVRWSKGLYLIFGENLETYEPSFPNYLGKIHSDDRERIRKQMQEVFENPVHFSHDERILRPDGSLRLLHTWGYPVLDKEGNVERSN